MISKKYQRNLLAVAVCIFLLVGMHPAEAQGGMQVNLYALQAQAFPSMSVGMDVWDAGGNFITGLQTGDIALAEDGQPIPLDAVEEKKPGTQFVLVLNTGPAFARRDANAVTRLDIIHQTLVDWASSRAGDVADDLGLVATGGPDSAHQNADLLLDSLSAYQPDPQTLTPSFDTLSRALDIVASEDPREGQKRAVLLISSLPEADMFSTLQAMTARAVQLHVRVFVWIVADESQFTLAGATALKDIAIQTGGQYLTFSGKEPLPSPETYLEPLRHTYLIRYTSRLTTSGSHTLTASVTSQGQTTTSEAATFDLDVQPPNPILVSPPDQVLRHSPDETTTDVLAFVPASQNIEMMVEFPDSHPRPLVRTALYVDGQKVAENASAPFERFTWDLRGYETSGQHTLQVEVQDSLGLSRVSLGVPVTVTVLQTKSEIGGSLKRNIIWLVGGAVALVGGILAVVLTAGSFRRRPVRKTEPRRRNDPLTQPVLPGSMEKTRPVVWAKRVKTPEAYLIRLRQDGQAVTSPPIAISADEITFGNDPTKVSNLIDDPSIAPLHARLTRTPEGSYLLADVDSPAGTWVNYERLENPRPLQHGDVFHVGQVSYRFMLHHAPEKPAPQLIPNKK